MKASIEDIRRFTFCPKFYEQQGVLKSKPTTEALRRLFVYAIRSLFEESSFKTLRELETRWRKIFFKIYESENFTQEQLARAYNKTQPGLKRFHEWYLTLKGCDLLGVNYPISLPYDKHQVDGVIPGVLLRDEAYVLVFFDDLAADLGVENSDYIRYLTSLIDSFSSTTVVQVMNLGINSDGNLMVQDFKPSPRFYQSALVDLASILDSMHEKHSYTSPLSCRACPLFEKGVCEALKG